MAEFAQILIRAKDETKTAFDSASRNMRGLEASATKLGGLLRTVSLGAGLSVAGFAAFAKSGIDAADAMQDMSDRIGVSVRDLASFKLAAQLADTSLEGVGNGIARLSRSIGEAENGNKKMAETLSTLGITARDPKEAFIQLADAVQRIQDPSQRAALLSQVLGKSYQELLPLLSQGGEALRKSAKESESFAEAMSRLAPEAGKLNDQLDILKDNAAKASASILSKLVPSFNEWIAVGQEVVKTGTLLDKVRFFGIGNASDEMVRRVRLNVVAASGWADKLRESAARLGEEKPDEVNTPDVKPKAIRGAGLDKESMIFADIAAAIKAADDELKQYAETRSFVLDGDLKRDNAVNAISQEWVEAGRALKESMLNPMEKLDNRIEYVNELWRRGAIDIETYHRAVADAFDKFAPKVDRVKTLAEELGEAFTGTLENAGSSIRNVGDLLDTLKQKVASVFANRASNYAANAITDFFFKPSANGNIFSSPALSAYSGSVVSSPTLFPFANGIGLMGEAGAEAILPLKRGRDGKLGVSVDGGGQSGLVVQVYNTIDARGADAGVETRIQRAVAEAVDQSVAKVQSMNQRGQLRLT